MDNDEFRRTVKTEVLVRYIRSGDFKDDLIPPVITA